MPGKLDSTFHYLYMQWTHYQETNNSRPPIELHARLRVPTDCDRLACRGTNQCFSRDSWNIRRHIRARNLFVWWGYVHLRIVWTYRPLIFLTRHINSCDFLHGSVKGSLFLVCPLNVRHDCSILGHQLNCLYIELPGIGIKYWKKSWIEDYYLQLAFQDSQVVRVDFPGWNWY